MAIICPNCGKEYDVTLFEYGHKVKCSCGETILLENKKYKDKYGFFKKLLSEIQTQKKEKQFEKLKSDSDRICRMILDKRHKAVDINIAINKFREKFLKLFPEKKYLYNMIYEARFNRLWNQFRA